MQNQNNCNRKLFPRKSTDPTVCSNFNESAQQFRENQQAATDEKRDAAVAHVMYTYTDTYAFNTHAERVLAASKTLTGELVKVVMKEFC